MQTVIVTATKVDSYELVFIVGNKVIAYIMKSQQFTGKYKGFVYGFSDSRQTFINLDYPDTLKFVSDCIERGFNRLGLNVEFK